MDVRRTPQPGEIWRAWIPYAEGIGGKERFCLVLGQQGDHVDVLKITSKDKSLRGDHLPMPTWCWDTSAEHDSWLQRHPPIRLPRSHVYWPAGPCDPHLWRTLSRRGGSTLDTQVIKVIKVIGAFLAVVVAVCCGIPGLGALARGELDGLLLLPVAGFGAVAALLLVSNLLGGNLFRPGGAPSAPSPTPDESPPLPRDQGDYSPHRGRVDRFDHDRGYGFITVKGGPRVFVHATAIDGAGEKVLHRGQWVALDIRENPRGPRAHNVRPL